jgi:hypothetical protein
VAQLRKLGSVLAYAGVKHACGKANVTLIWALGGKLTDIRWRVIARKHRTIPLLARVEQQLSPNLSLKLIRCSSSA